jgi:hypothetical protein
MEIQEIEVIIDRNGEVRIQVHGTTGTRCLDLTSDLETALGGEVISREMTTPPEPKTAVQADDRQKIEHG